MIDSRLISSFAIWIKSKLVIWCFWVLPTSVLATNYYVSPTGSDLASGTTPAQAWQSITRVNAATLNPGDSVFFEGSQSFSGNLVISGCGTAANPIIVSSYGTGRATLNAGSTGHGIYVFDCAGFEIYELNIVGSGRSTNNYEGIYFFTNVFRLSTLSYLRLHDLEISGFNKGGLKIEADENTTWKAYDDIEITYVEVHDCGDHGIETFGRVLTGTEYAFADIYVAHCTVYDNPGEIGKTTKHTGNGIVIGNSNGALIEYCEAYNNGAENVNTTGGPVGIWAWDCYLATIQYCESHHNKTGPASGKDGGGFDLDGGCVQCVLQYNYSHDNYGSGYLIAEYVGARPMHGITVRFNISENDARINSYGAIQLWNGESSGYLDSVAIYNNTIYVGPSALGGVPSAIKSISGNLFLVKVANNVFVTSGGVRLVDKSHNASANIQFVGNAYFSLNGSYEYYEGGTLYTSLPSWRTGKGQEELSGGIPTGIQGDPQLNNPGGGGTIGNPLNLTNLPAYQTPIASPLEDAGQDLMALFNIDVGNYDYYGTTIPVNLIHDIGAYESLGSVLNADPDPLDPVADWPEQNLFPNPAQHYTHLQLTDAAGKWVRIWIHDAQGKLMLDSAMAVPPSGLIRLSQINKLAAGLYLLRVRSESHSYAFKLQVSE